MRIRIGKGIRNVRLPHSEVYFLRSTASEVLLRNLLHGIATRSFVVQWKCAQILAPGRLNFLRCRLIFVGPQVGIRFVSFSEMGPGFLEKLWK
jgi:hypothetical protein